MSLSAEKCQGCGRGPLLLVAGLRVCRHPFCPGHSAITSSPLTAMEAASERERPAGSAGRAHAPTNPTANPTITGGTA